MAGLYFEEFSEGQVFEHAMTRTVTEMDNVLFTTLTMNPQPLHLDAEFAKTTEFGRPLVNSIFTLGLVIGMTVGDTTLGTTVANLGMSDVRFPKPVFHGDTIRARTTVVSTRRSQVALGCRHRRVRACRLQPARRRGRDLPPRRADEDKTGMMTVDRRRLLRFARNDSKGLSLRGAQRRSNPQRPVVRRTFDALDAVRPGR